MKKATVETMALSFINLKLLLQCNSMVAKLSYAVWYHKLFIGKSIGCRRWYLVYLMLNRRCIKHRRIDHVPVHAYLAYAVKPVGCMLKRIIICFGQHRVAGATHFVYDLKIGSIICSFYTIVSNISLRWEGEANKLVVVLCDKGRICKALLTICLYGEELYC